VVRKLACPDLLALLPRGLVYLDLVVAPHGLEGDLDPGRVSSASRDAHLLTRSAFLSWLFKVNLIRACFSMMAANCRSRGMVCFGT
jgi:hypothetical protein